jgi:hypothetical protein
VTSLKNLNQLLTLGGFKKEALLECSARDDALRQPRLASAAQSKDERDRGHQLSRPYV